MCASAMTPLLPGHARPSRPRTFTLRDALDLDLPEGTEVFATEPVRGVRMEGFTVTHEIPGAAPTRVAGVYENRFPDYRSARSPTSGPTAAPSAMWA